MAEQTSDVHVVRVDYVCDKCNEGVMRPTGYVLTSYQAQYQHACTKCDARAMFEASYPAIRFDPVAPPREKQ